MELPMQKIVNWDVAGYPDCMDTGCNVMAVMCHDETIDMYACYVGIVKLIVYDPEHPELYQESKKIAAQYVARFGNKQSVKEARKYFSFPEARYRE
jgi:hypothetical protein